MITICLLYPLRASLPISPSLYFSFPLIPLFLSPSLSHFPSHLSLDIIHNILILTIINYPREYNIFWVALEEQFNDACMG